MNSSQARSTWMFTQIRHRPGGTVDPRFRPQAELRGVFLDRKPCDTGPNQPSLRDGSRVGRFQALRAWLLSFSPSGTRPSRLSS